MLTPEEQAELAELEQWDQSQGLSADEQAELAELEQWDAAPKDNRNISWEEEKRKNSRALKGATSMLTGPFQLGANIGDYLSEQAYKIPHVGKYIGDDDPWMGDYVNQKLRDWKDYNDEYRDSTGADPIEIAGMLGSPVNILKTGVTKAAPKVQEALMAQTTRNMGNASKVGGLYGTMLPSSGENIKEQLANRAMTGTTSAVLAPVLPAAFGAAKGLGHYADQLTRPMGFRNNPESWLMRHGAKPGIKTDIAETAKDQIGPLREKMVEGLSRAKPGETSSQALARASLENTSQYGPKQPETIGAPFVKLFQEVKKTTPNVDKTITQKHLDRQTQVDAISRIAGTDKTRQADEAARAARAASGYRPSVMNAKVDPRSNAQLLDAMANKAQEKALKAEMAKAQAMQDWGRFETLKAQLNQLSLGKPPIQNVPGKSSLRTQSSRDTSLQTESSPGVPMTPAMAPVRPVAQPEVPNMYNSPRFKGEVPGPSRYAPQRSVSQEAGRAAEAVKKIAAQRLAEQKVHSGINEQMLLNKAGESGKSLDDFALRPSIMKGIKVAKASAAEKGAYFPSKPGENYSVANLQRIKRSISDDIDKLDTRSDALSPTVKREYTDTANSFTKWLRGKSKAFADADDIFAADSVAVNQSKAGVELLAAFNKTPKQFINYLNNPKNADTLAALSEKQMASINKIKDELTIDLTIKNMTSSKNITGQLNKIKEIVMPEQPNPLIRVIMVLKSALRGMTKDKYREYEKILGKMDDDPEYFMEMMKGNTEFSQWAASAISKTSAIGSAQSTSQGAN